MGDRENIISPNVEVKGDVRFDLQFLVLRDLKYTVVCTLKVLQQLTVQKSKSGRQICE